MVEGGAGRAFEAHAEQRDVDPETVVHFLKEVPDGKPLPEYRELWRAFASLGQLQKLACEGDYGFATFATKETPAKLVADAAASVAGARLKFKPYKLTPRGLEVGAECGGSTRDSASRFRTFSSPSSYSSSFLFKSQLTRVAL